MNNQHALHSFSQPISFSPPLVSFILVLFFVFISPQSDALLQSSLDSVVSLYISLVSSCSSSPSSSISRSRAESLLVSRSLQLLHLCVTHAHPFIHCFFARVWRILHDTFQGTKAATGVGGNFEKFATQLVVQTLIKSNNAQQQQKQQRSNNEEYNQWTLNAAQSKLVQLLADNAHTLAYENQVNQTKTQNANSSSISLIVLISVHPESLFLLSIISFFCFSFSVLSDVHFPPHESPPSSFFYSYIFLLFTC